MDYIFGTIDLYGEIVESLKTVGPRHSNLVGVNEISRTYIDSTIVDTFFVLHKYESTEDAEGTCYDWYIIKNHSRYVDYTPKQDSTFAELLGSTDQMLQRAEQTRKALQMFTASLSDEQAMEIATLYDEWQANKKLVAGTILSFGTNSVGDPQLYRVVQNHTSQEDWLPNETPALYTVIGLTAEGYTEWSQPTGAHDAYNQGDIVSYQNTLYISNIDGNTTVPGSDERWWSIYTPAE